LTETGTGRVWETGSPTETFALGESMGRCFAGGLVIGLVGELGAGKTLLVKGMASGSGVSDPNVVTSPTFTLVHEYEASMLFYHLDAYRLSGCEELTALGFDEMTSCESVVVVEWADRVRKIMPDDTLWIELTAVGETSRRLSCSAGDDFSRRCLAAMWAQVR